jgi:hypothetical protein
LTKLAGMFCRNSRRDPLFVLWCDRNTQSFYAAGFVSGAAFAFLLTSNTHTHKYGAAFTMFEHPDCWPYGFAAMRHVRQILRDSFIWVLVLLTIVSGRVAPGCLCADGHFELLCPGQQRREAHSPAVRCDKCHHHRTCCAHRHEPCRLVDASRADCPEGCCRPLTLSPMITEQDCSADSVAGESAVECTIAGDLIAAVASPADSHRGPDCRPQRDLLSRFQSLQI